jgi:acyl dehydratase
VYSVRARNNSPGSENRMHSDEVARRYGFRGGLVPGVTVFGLMTRPVLARYGAAWLERGWAEVSFSKPAYEGELLAMRDTVASARTDGSIEVSCTNETGVELARLRAGMLHAPAVPDARAAIPPAQPLSSRPGADWNLMIVGEPFPALLWHPTTRENVAWCEDLSDDLPLYREGEGPLLHPGLVLRQANNVLKNRFVLPAWIHTASRIAFHDALRAGRRYEVRAIPEEKWVRKGNEFVRLYVAILAGDGVAAEISHTAIFRPREAETSAGS